MAPERFDLLTTTACEIQKLYSQRQLSTVGLLCIILRQICTHNRKGANLRAMIAIPPLDQLFMEAERLDEERQMDRVRGPLHGIPLIVHDMIATHPGMGMDTTAGSTALMGTKPAKSALAVARLVQEGVIIIGKTNLTEWGMLKGEGHAPAWSAVGGFTASAFVHGALRMPKRVDHISNPGGAASGCAVGVSAGFGILGLGVETVEDVILPASRAGLYAMRPTHNSVSLDGVILHSRGLDSLGAMARCPSDLLEMMKVLRQTEPSNKALDLKENTSQCLQGIRLGFVDEMVWHRGIDDVEDLKEEPSKRMNYRQAMNKLENAGVTCRYPVELIDYKLLLSDIAIVCAHEFSGELADYLSHLGNCEHHCLLNILMWNIANSEREKFSGMADLDQEHLIEADNSETSALEASKALKRLRSLGGEFGIDHALRINDVDAIVTPSESHICSVATAAGYPMCTMHLSTLLKNGRPYGMTVVAGKHNERKLFQIMSG